MKKILLVSLVCFSLGGCTAQIVKYENAEGKVAICRATGYGLVGVVTADNYMEKCDRLAVDQGYKKVKEY